MPRASSTLIAPPSLSCSGDERRPATAAAHHPIGVRRRGARRGDVRTMADDERPAVVAFDGSDAAGAAVRAAASLLTGRHLLIVSVWEPGLAFAIAPMHDISGVAYAAPSPDQVAAIDRAQRDHAVD